MRWQWSVVVVGFLAACDAGVPDKPTDKAIARAEAAREQAADAKATADATARELANVDAQIATAVDAVIAAQTDTERLAAKTKLQRLQRKKAELQGHVVHVSQECLDNPLAKGCS
jgi:hypothetical protein